jgi:hypothetical protein
LVCKKKSEKYPNLRNQEELEQQVLQEFTEDVWDR